MAKRYRVQISSADRRTSGRPPSGSALDRVFAGFLRAHERACRLGNPLLTEGGVFYVRQQLLQLVNESRLPPGHAPLEEDDGHHPSPSWDAEGRCLWLGDRLLLRFRQPAPHQTRLLEAFEEQRWLGGHIDDPLPRFDLENDEDAKRRLHETIKNLNRRLPAGTIRFRGDGTGQGVWWEYQGAWARIRRQLDRIDLAR
jgi:hypothetical protein